MTDSNERDSLDTKHEHDREQRIEVVKRWVEYIKSEPPEKWGPQQNAIVNEQLDAAQSLQMTAAHKQHVRDVAAEISKDEHQDSAAKE